MDIELVDTQNKIIIFRSSSIRTQVMFKPLMVFIMIKISKLFIEATIKNIYIKC